MTKKSQPYVKRTITMIGDTTSDEPCEICQEADAYISPLVEHDNRIEYKKVEVSTPEGEKIADAKKVSSIPYFEDCKYVEGSDKPKCERISGFQESDWGDLKEILDKPATEEVKTDEQGTAEDKAE